jgi:hypothetical protein
VNIGEDANAKRLCPAWPAGMLDMPIFHGEAETWLDSESVARADYSGACSCLR